MLQEREKSLHNLSSGRKPRNIGFFRVKEHPRASTKISNSKKRRR